MEPFKFGKIKFDISSRYVRPKRIKGIKPIHVKYEHALDFVKDVGLVDKHDRVFAVIAGSFVFGDLIEAYVVEHNLAVKNLTLSTLSLSENNIDSLANLINGGYVEKLNLVVSDYFYSHERRGLVKQLYSKLDKEDKFQLAVARVHTKITLIETEEFKYVIHGSANLRSLDNIEQLIFEESEDLFDFNMEWHNRLLEEYYTIKKNIGGKKLWQIVETEEKGKVEHPVETLKNRKV